MQRVMAGKSALNVNRSPAGERADGQQLNGHDADFFFDIGSLDHGDRVPGAAVEEAAIRPFADALLAANAEDRVHLNAAKRWMVFVRHPEHAIFNRTIFHAGRRSGATGAALGDDREFFGFLLAWGEDPLGLRFELQFVRNQPGALISAGMAGIIPHWRLAGTFSIASAAWFGVAFAELFAKWLRDTNANVLILTSSPLEFGPGSEPRSQFHPAKGRKEQQSWQVKVVNRVNLIGNLGKDPEVKYTPQGTPVAKLTIATNERFKDKSGEWQDRTEWHNVVLWQRLAEIAGEYLKKGGKVYIEGRLQTHSWDDKNTGQKKYMTEVVGSDLILLGGRGEGGGGDFSGSRGASAGGNNFDQRMPEPEPAELRPLAMRTYRSRKAGPRIFTDWHRSSFDPRKSVC